MLLLGFAYRLGASVDVWLPDLRLYRIEPHNDHADPAKNGRSFKLVWYPVKGWHAIVEKSLAFDLGELLESVTPMNASALDVCIDNKLQ